MPLLIICIVLVVILTIYLVLIATKSSKNVRPYTKVDYAHRGLHDGERAENSMSALRAAVEAGYGIELDIRLSSDGELVVFHDDTLLRVCGREGRVIDFTADELAAFKLSGTEDGIPRFCDVLKLVSGRVPLLVEIKEQTGDTTVSAKAAEVLQNYEGDFIVESFNPLSLKNYKKCGGKGECGLLSQRYLEYENCRKPIYFLLQTLLLNRLCNPAFIAYDHRHASAFSLRVVRRIFRAVTFAWTVRSEEEYIAAKKNGFDSIIFEGFIPPKQ